MLFGLGLGGSLLTGFGMAAATARSSIHMLVLASTLTVTFLRRTPQVPLPAYKMRKVL